MKLLINISNLAKGGSLQVAHSFLEDLKKNDEDNYYVIINTILFYPF